MAKILTVFTVRPEIDNVVDDVPANLDVQRKLSLFERLLANAAVRRVLLLVCLAVIWELYALHVDNPLLFPRFSETLVALWNALVYGPLLDRMASSLRILLVDTGSALRWRAFSSPSRCPPRSARICSPRSPRCSIRFRRSRCCRWPCCGSGWAGQPGVRDRALGAVGGRAQRAQRLHLGQRNAADERSELRAAGRALRDADPDPRGAALDPLRLKIGWAFAWRTLIAAELVFGATSRSGGLGWFIYENRNQLETPSVFAGLFVVIIIGLLVESVIFRFIESRTVRRWGMQR